MTPNLNDWRPEKDRLCRLIMQCSLEEWEREAGRELAWGDLREEAQWYAR